MKCDGVRGLLSAYLDGELTSGELLRVEQHLRRCHACASEVESLRKTIAMVAGLDEVPLPADFHARLHQRLVALGPPTARRPVVPAWQRSLRTWAIPAVAAAAALAVGLSTLQDAADPAGILAVPRIIDLAQNRAATPTVSAPAPTTEPNPAPNVTTEPGKQPVVSTPAAEPVKTSGTQGEAAAPSTPTSPTTTAVAPPTPIGTANWLSEVHAASYLEGLPQMASIPAYANEYQFTYPGNDPVRIGKALEAKFSGKVEVTDSQVTLKLSNAEAEAALKVVREILGTVGVKEEYQRPDYGGAKERAYTSLQHYDRLRDELYGAQAKVTDQTVRETAARELDTYRQIASELKQEISRIQGFVNETTVVIKFAKQVQ